MAPWRMPSASARDDMLAWFLAADLGTGESLKMLQVLTGRPLAAPWQVTQLRSGTSWIRAKDPATRAWLRKAFSGVHVVEGRPSSIPKGVGETGRHVIPHPTTRRRFVDYYRAVRDRLLQAEEQRRAELQGDMAVQRIGFSFALLTDYLSDASIDVARSPRGDVVRPARPEQVSRSLVGELAVAMFFRLIGGKSLVVCRYCGTAKLVNDYRRRLTCGDERCIRDNEREWKRLHPEEPGSSTARVRTWRKGRRT